MRKMIRIALILSLSVSNAFAQDARDAYRAKIREWVMSRARSALPALPTIAPLRNDQASDLVDELRFTNLAKMEDAQLMSARLENGPWSSSYWPLYAGQIAGRYADPNYTPGLNWSKNARYLESVIGKGRNEELSASEKYDLLVGDAAFTLTRKNINAGAPYADRDGSVPTWFGICHGWAPASFMESRPRHSVTVKAADGRELTFTPSDLKALASLLWANGAGETKFIGGRCNQANPPRDPVNHRETDPDCFDTNPATWHLAVVNQIGVAKRSFVADVSPGAEVWNQPAVGYRYTYVNAASGAAAASLAAAKVRLKDWREDPYSATRSPNAVYVVKVQMSFEYGSETQPSTFSDDRPDLDAHASQNWVYDLELDESGEIVGGEWYSYAHPDFLWVPVKGSHASSVGDDALDRQNDHAVWAPGESVPRAWRAAAKNSSANEQPLARIVEKLLELSNGAN